MISGVLFWGRRSWRLAPFFLMLYALNVVRFTAKFDDWSMMFNTVAGSTMLVGPATAATACHALHTSWPTGARDVGHSLPQPHRPVLEITAAVSAWVLLVHLVVLSCGSLLCWLNGAYANSITLPWQLLTAPAALLACAALGMLMMQLMPRLVTIGLVAVIIYAIEISFDMVGLPQLLTVIQPTSPMRGMRLVWRHLAVTIALNLTLTLLFGSLASWWAHPRGRRPRHLLLIAAVSVAGLGLGLWWWAGLDPWTYEFL